MVKVIKKFDESKCGYLDYNTMCKEVDEILESMIEYNVIHLRPYFKLCSDLNPAPQPTKAIITAESPVELFAMKNLIPELYRKL